MTHRKDKIKIQLIAGARPNFVKIAALWRAFTRFKESHPNSNLVVQVIHTGQHYDYLMARKFFQDLCLPTPEVNLEVGSSSHAVQTARMMVRFEKVSRKERPDLVMVVGDVNSTLACSLVASKMEIPVAHVEAGLRSFDRSMPEEINRRLTDSLSDYLFTTSEDGNRNLLREGIAKGKIFFVGNVMVDTLLAHLNVAGQSRIKQKLGLRKKDYAVLTLHRPSNVDHDSDFNEILMAIERLQQRIPVVFPAHPRTAQRLRNGLFKSRIESLKNLYLTPPLGYLDFINLLKDAKLVLTDSGGIQEETSILGNPCLTLRDNTERPVTIRQGTNVLAGRKASRIIELALASLNNGHKRLPRTPELWDGRAAERIAGILQEKFGF
jgi:UDP-N-acetylglucosamine 2-epimerase (non-hydrolysing)